MLSFSYNYMYIINANTIPTRNHILLYNVKFCISMIQMWMHSACMHVLPDVPCNMNQRYADGYTIIIMVPILRTIYNTWVDSYTCIKLYYYTFNCYITHWIPARHACTYTVPLHCIDTQQHYRGIHLHYGYISNRHLCHLYEYGYRNKYRNTWLHTHAKWPWTSRRFSSFIFFFSSCYIEGTYLCPSSIYMTWGFKHSCHDQLL